MRRHLGHGLCIATLLIVTSCGGDDESASDSTVASTDVGDGTGVSTDSSGPDGSSHATDGSDASETTAAGSSSTAGSTSSTTVAGSTGTTVAGSTLTTVAGSTDTVAGTSATTVAGSATTSPPPSTNAVPETTSDLVLMSDGVGPLRFGTAADAVIGAISAVLGTPSSDAPAEYPLPEGGGFTSEDAELGFAQPFGRTVCWLNGFCGEFGGTVAGAYTFFGWFYAATDVDELAAPSGLDVGSTWADFADIITVQPGGCYSVGYGTADGVTLAMQSSGDPFVNVDDDGNETLGSPNPADVTIMQMQAGEQVTYLFEDC